MRLAGHEAHRGLVGRREGRSLGRPRRRWEDNIKMELQEEGRGGINWKDCGNELSGSTKCREFLD